MKNRKIIHAERGRIYHFELRQQSFDETIKQLTESKTMAEKDGYFDFSLWFSCGYESSSAIYIKAKRYETDSEYSQRLVREEENKSLQIVIEEEKEQQEKKLYEELKQKYENEEVK
jgi:hypothetical protein